MIERGHGADFAVEALVETLGGDFDGDIATGARVVRTVHFPHPALANERKDFVRAEFVAGLERHVNESAKFNPSSSG